MINLAMDLDKYLEKSLTWCWNFISASPKRKSEDRVDEKGNKTFFAQYSDSRLQF
jgi:hypothetical protein